VIIGAATGFGSLLLAMRLIEEIGFKNDSSSTTVFKLAELAELAGICCC
jgi:hypothetical protein